MKLAATPAGSTRSMATGAIVQVGQRHSQWQRRVHHGRRHVHRHRRRDAEQHHLPGCRRHVRESRRCRLTAAVVGTSLSINDNQGGLSNIGANGRLVLTNLTADNGAAVFHAPSGADFNAAHITNNGVISVIDGLAGSTAQRYLTGSILNQGTISIHRNTTNDFVRSTWDNKGILDLGAGDTLTFADTHCGGCQPSVRQRHRWFDHRLGHFLHGRQPAPHGQWLVPGSGHDRRNRQGRCCTTRAFTTRGPARARSLSAARRMRWTATWPRVRS